MPCSSQAKKRRRRHDSGSGGGKSNSLLHSPFPSAEVGLHLIQDRKKSSEYRDFMSQQRSRIRLDYQWYSQWPWRSQRPAWVTRPSQYPTLNLVCPTNHVSSQNKKKDVRHMGTEVTVDQARICIHVHCMSSAGTLNITVMMLCTGMLTQDGQNAGSLLCTSSQIKDKMPGFIFRIISMMGSAFT